MGAFLRSMPWGTAATAGVDSVAKGRGSGLALVGAGGLARPASASASDSPKVGGEAVMRNWVRLSEGRSGAKFQRISQMMAKAAAGRMAAAVYLIVFVSLRGKFGTWSLCWR